MLNANNEISVKKEERKHSWSTVFAWLYLKTIGRILPKRWNRWAENILYYDKTTANNEVQTDAFKTVDKSAQVDLKPEVAKKESQSVVISKDGGVQTEESNEFIFNDNYSDDSYLDMEEVNTEEDEALKEHLEGISQELELERSQNASLKEENIELQSVIERHEKDYKELAENAGKREEELTEHKTELINKTRKLSAEVEEKDARINTLITLNEALKQDIKEIETRSNEQQQIAEIYMKLNELLLNVTEIPEKTLQLNNQEQQEEKKSLENKILELQKQVQTLEGNKEWELAGIDGTLKATFLTIMELLAQQLLNNQEQSVKEQKLEELTLSYNDQAHQMEELQSENDFLEEQNRELRFINRELEEERSKVARLKEESIQSKIELASDIVKAFEDSERKCMKTGSLTLLDEELGASVEKLSDQLYKVKSIERQQPQSTQGSQQQLEGETIDLEDKLKIEQLQKEQKQIKNVLDEVNKLQEEKRNMEEQLKIMQQQLLNDQERQRMGEELKDVDKRLKDINEKTKKSQEHTKVQRKPLQDKNLEHFLSDRNMGLKKDFPEFKEKNFLLNFLRKTVRLVSNKQDDKFQGRELLNLFKSNLKELAKEVIENRVKEVVIDKGNKYYQVSKNIDKELLDGTIHRNKLKDKLLPSVKQCMKKLELDVKGAITITNSIVDKLCDKENNNKSPALREIVVRDLTEARMKTFLEKVKEINFVPNNVPNSFMSHTNNTKHVLSLGNVRTGS